MESTSRARTGASARRGAEGPRKRPGGRSERVRLAVAHACLDLVAEGNTDFGPREVASRSGVSHATIYRRWPTRADLLREALSVHTSRLDPPDTGSWEGDVHALVEQLRDFFCDPIEVTHNAILASGKHPAFDEIMLDYYAPVLASWRGIVERAAARGELRPGVDPDLVIMMLASPLQGIPLFLRRRPTAAEAEGIVDMILAATKRVPSSEIVGLKPRRGHQSRKPK